MNQGDPKQYEVLINGVVLATDVEEAQALIAEGRWLNYQNEDGEQHGKIVHLFPIYRRTRVVKFAQVGDLIPALLVEGERLDQLQIKRFAVGIVLTIVADSESDAANYTANRGWFVPGTGFEVSLTSGPTGVGTYGALGRVLQV